ncbi:MAG: sensor histidine kinase [Planctomycetota bacterium]|jgi:signal transduction histidine kinase
MINRSGSGQLRWVILLLAVAVILPTVCLLWFMSQAVKNERLAVRQRLIDSYKNSLGKLKEYNEDIWLKLTNIPARAFSDNLRDFFKNVVQTHNYGMGDYDHGDAVVVYDANGSILYPVLKTYDGSLYEDRVSDVNAFLWRYEFIEKDYAAAAKEYKKMASESTVEAVRLQTLIAAIRNLRKAGEIPEALKQCEQILTGAEKNDIQQFQPLMHLRLMHIAMLRDTGSPDYAKKVSEFVNLATEYQRLWDYTSAEYEPMSPPSASNIFFLQKAVELAKGTGAAFAAERNTLAEKLITAETLSIEVATKYPDDSVLLDLPERTVERLGHGKDLFGYYLGNAGKKAFIIFDSNNLRLFFEIYSTRSFPKDLDYRITDEAGNCVLGLENPRTPALLKYPVNKYFPRWEISVFLKDDDLFTSAAQKQTAVYMWAGALVIVLILASGGIAGQAVGRQMKLNRLKNDFIATVSHELKTPLASMRVLADTLLEGNYKDQKQATEYLHLICKENKRLSGLIDNFLTFSRMERNKHAFEMANTSPAVIANAAVEAVKTKFSKGKCEFEVTISDDSPDVLADQDAMVTVLVNLLDNAYKYSDDDKHIEFRVFTEDGLVCFSVSDNGIGLSQRAIKKIFKRFYQVDRSLSREAEGCGLGLSITKFIVDAHKGSISVESNLGKGSLFIVRLPIAN